jgi:hypothetical protein
MGTTTAVIYVEKQLGVDTSSCKNTPPFALTNLVNQGKPRAANHDVTTVRVATTTDGITFQDVGPALGLFDPTTTDFSGTRYLGSGSIIPWLMGVMECSSAPATASTTILTDSITSATPRP